MHDAPPQTARAAALVEGRVPVAVDTPEPVAPGLRGAVVRAVVPCHNRVRDLELLLGDLARLDLQTASGPIDLSVIVVDNASEPPLPSPPAGGPLTVLRLSENAGGSGGFNAGLHAHLSRWDVPSAPSDFLWLVDSDARLREDTLKVLAETLLERPGLAAVGAALADPSSGEIFEVGGRVDRKDGSYGPAHEDLPESGEPVVCDYVASCCALVRRAAVEQVGLMPDRFINGDDVEWFIRLARGTGLDVACAPRAVAFHPRFDRFPTWTRAYAARNALGPIDALGLGLAVRLRRGFRAVGRAVNQAMMGRDDLAALHIGGLRECAAGRTTGRIEAPLPKAEPFAPMDTLGEALQRHAGQQKDVISAWFHPALDLPEDATAELHRQVDLAHVAPQEPSVRSRPMTDGWAPALWRALIGPKHDVAVVPAEGRPASWFRGRVMVEVVPEGFVIRRIGRFSTLWSGAMTTIRALVPAIGGALRRGDRQGRTPAATPAASASTGVSAAALVQSASLSVVVLSFNRREALQRTLEHLARDPALAGAEIIVADNGSSDGSAFMVKEGFPGARLLEIGRNLGVAAFNRAVEASRGELVLVLDDDARPEPAALANAVVLLATRADLGAVALHPRHPSDGRSEWPFAEGSIRRDDWPVMGCANLVRREDWVAVGGYEESFFLYRNDTDLAMKLLGAGRGVGFDPAWVVWHDSPAAARKSARWFETATRNWVWLARRHGRGISGFAGALMGWAWAHRLAGLSAGLQWRVLRGAWAGIVQPPAPMTPDVQPDGQAFARLVSLQLKSRAGNTGNRTATSAGGTGAADSREEGSPARRNGTIDSSMPRHSP